MCLNVFCFAFVFPFAGGSFALFSLKCCPAWALWVLTSVAPLCGLSGNGGYAMDGVRYLLCTEGNYSCLWFQVQDHGREPEDIILNALEKVLRTHKLVSHREILERVVTYLI